MSFTYHRQEVQTLIVPSTSFYQYDEALKDKALSAAAYVDDVNKAWSLDTVASKSDN